MVNEKMKNIKTSLSTLFSSSRRNSNASSDSDQKEDPDVRPPKFISILTKRSYMFHRCFEEGDQGSPVTYERRFSVPNGEDEVSDQKKKIVEVQYPIYQWPSFRRKPSKRRHSVAGAQSDTIKQFESTLEPVMDEVEEMNPDLLKPSFASLQAEDKERRPSLVMYQSEDTEHPDVIALQKLVDKIYFSEQ